MPRRNYNIFDWQEGETIDDRYGDVKHSAQINVLGIEENNGGGGRYLLEITDDENMDKPIMFGVTINIDGRVTDFQDFTHFPLYVKIKLESPTQSKEVEHTIVSVMGNDLGKTLYTIDLKHKRYISKAVEFEIAVSPTEKLSYIQEPPNMPWQRVDKQNT